MSLRLGLGRCVSEVDISMADRIGHLLFPRPYFEASKTNRSPKPEEPPQPQLHLSEELEIFRKRDAPPTPPMPSSNLLLECPEWTVNLRSKSF